jgi:RNA polymerase sigma factor (TIGR02999 family)
MPKRESPDEIFSVAYEELRRLAASVRRDDPAATLSPTHLVNEAWLKLAGSPELADTTPLHFRRIAAQAMRQLLVEAARRRNARKAGVGLLPVTFDDGLDIRDAGPSDVIGLHEALERLARLDPRQAMMVESRFFGGLSIGEIAQVLGVSEATVQRDWRAARAFLASNLPET